MHQPPSKTLLSSFLPSPPVNQQTVEAPPFLGNSPHILVFGDPPSKSQIFQWTPKVLKFFILNTILSFKVTKFLGTISQFEFLVITEKNIFAYKLFLSLNISDFNSFLCENCTPPEKSHPPPSNLPSKSWGPVKPPPLFKNLVGGSTPLQNGGGGAPYVKRLFFLKNSLIHQGITQKYRKDDFLKELGKL